MGTFGPDWVSFERWRASAESRPRSVNCLQSPKVGPYWDPWVRFHASLPSFGCSCACKYWSSCASSLLAARWYWLMSWWWIGHWSCLPRHCWSLYCSRELFKTWLASSGPIRSSFRCGNSGQSWPISFDSLRSGKRRKLAAELYYSHSS